MLTGLSGLYMLYYLNAWDRFFDASYWWMHAMVFVWFIFTLVLYVLEPLVLHKLFKQYAIENPKKTFDFIHKAHWFLLILSLLTIAGAIAGCHGWFFFH